MYLSAHSTVANLNNNIYLQVYLSLLFCIKGDEMILSILSPLNEPIMLCFHAYFEHNILKSIY